MTLPNIPTKKGETPNSLSQGKQLSISRLNQSLECTRLNYIKKIFQTVDKFGYLNTLANIASVKIIWAKLINNLGQLTKGKKITLPLEINLKEIYLANFGRFQWIFVGKFDKII